MAREVTSKNIDGIADLVLVVPIREGFINAYENVTYATRLRIVAEALNRIRVSAREHEFGVPFSDVAERILTLLDFRIGVIDKDLFSLERDPKSKKYALQARRYLYLTATFDTAWEPYMRLIWDPLGPFLDLIFCNCEGFVAASDNSCEDYLAWVRSNQVDPAIFYATTATTIRDDVYHGKIDRLLREVDRPTRELDILRQTVPNPEEQADKVRQHAMNALLNPKPGDQPDKKPFFKIQELALEVVTVLYRLADFYPPEWLFDKLKGDPERELKEGKYLARVAYSILKGWDYERLSASPALQGFWDQVKPHYREPLEWYSKAAAVASNGTVPKDMGRPVSDDPSHDPGQVQSGILEQQGLMQQPVLHGALLMLTIGKAQDARTFLREHLAVHFDGDVPPADGLFRTVGFTKDGLRRLELELDVLDQLPKEFREGMEARSGLIGDLRENHPRRWQLPQRNWPPGEAAKRPPVDLSEIDLVIQLRYAPCAEADPTDTAPMLAEIERIAGIAGAFDVQLVAYQPMSRTQVAHGDPGQFTDHFGFADGISQPDVQRHPVADLFAQDAEKAKVWNNRARLGEVLLGYRNDRDDFAPIDNPDDTSGKLTAIRAARRLTFNGSFLAIRKLRQHRAVFDRTMEEQAQRLTAEGIAITADQLAYQLIGRRRDGSPLITPDKDNNDFDYTGDKFGTQCPFASHIRRTNPRDFVHGRPAPRIVRRGMSFGPPYVEGEPAGSTPERGLMFMCYQSSLAEQFEVLQRWINGGNSSGVASSQNDPLLGVSPKPGPESYGSDHGAPRLFQFEWAGKVARIEMAEPFVTLDWGLYLFVPSRIGLKKLSKVLPLRTISDDVKDFKEPRELVGARRISQISAMPEKQQKFEWKRLLEDFDVKDPAERALSPDVWSAVRWYYGGSYRIKSGVSKYKPDDKANQPGQLPRVKVSAKYDPNTPTVLTASIDHALQVLADWKRFSVREQLERFEKASGAIYVAQQPDNDYGGSEAVGEYVYKEEAEHTNAVLMGYSREQGFAAGYRAGKTVLGAARRRAGDAGLNYYKLELRRQYLTPVIGLICTEWFGLPDWDPFKEDLGKVDPAQAPESAAADAIMLNGSWNWNVARDSDDMDQPSLRQPTCPGDCMSASRYAFYPKPTPGIEMFGIDQGLAIRKAGKDYIRRHLANGTWPKGTLINAMFGLLESGKIKSEDVLARNLIGIMLGAIPPMEGSMRGILLEWLGEKSLWRNQAAYLRARDGGADHYQAAIEALEVPMTRAMCKRPAPDLLYRRATEKVVLKGRGKKYSGKYRSTVIEKDDLVIVNLASAAQRSLFNDPDGPGDVSIIFGGERSKPLQDDSDAVKTSHPVHACPGRDLAMGAMYGILAALLEEGKIQALPASLIIKVSDWR